MTLETWMRMNMAMATVMPVVLRHRSFAELDAASLEIRICRRLAEKLFFRRRHRDRTRASALCFIFLFFSSFEHVKSLLIMGPKNTKNSSKSVICSYLTMNNIVGILFLL